MSSDYFCEFSCAIAKKYGVDLAIIHGFYKKVQYLSSLQGDKIGSYPTVEHCCSVLTFWSEDKIRELIGALYTNKLV